MPTCVCCGERVSPDRAVCPICGTKVLASALSVEEYRAADPVAPATAPADLPSGALVCPSCSKAYPADHAETFCECGTELVSADRRFTARAGETARTAIDPSPPPEKPPPGTRCLVLYGADKRPRRYFPLQKDVTLIGRLDAVEGVFPEIDLSECLEKDAARRVSRRHAIVLHSRATGTYILRPLAGNTGTQIDADMVPPLEDHTLEPGRRIVLGGAVRFKFEIT